MKRDDFVFAIGFQGDTAIVDRRNRASHKGKSASQLVEAGLYRPAFCAALYDEDEAGAQAVLEAYNRIGERTYRTIEDLKRLLGAYSVPEGVSSVHYV